MDLLLLIALVLIWPLKLGAAPESKARPIDYSTFKWYNELPQDREADPSLQHLSFYSQANQADVGFYLYLPDGYYDEENRKNRYPTIYFLHGGRPGAEYKGLGRFPFMKDGIKRGLRPPVIYVIPNGGKLSHYDWGNAKGATAFLELVEHIDRAYRTIKDRRGRVLEGGSQGGRGVTRYLFRHPELFSSAIAMAPGHQWEKIISENNGIESEYLTIDDGSINTWDLAAGYAKRKDAPPIRFMNVIGDQDANYPGNLGFHEHLKKLGIEHEFVVVKGAGHGIDFSVDNVGDRILSFQTESFRQFGIID